MIKTIYTTEITEEMFQAFRDHYVNATRCIFAVLEAAPAVEPVQRCNCCGYLVTDSEHRGCLRAAKQEPAQSGAEPVGYISGWIDGHLTIRLLDPALALSTGTALFLQPPTVPPAISEPAQAVPVFWASENILKESLRDNISCILTTTKCAANTVPLYTAPPTIDDETRKRVLELCNYLHLTNLVSPLPFYSRIKSTVEDLKEKLEAE